MLSPAGDSHLLPRLPLPALWLSATYKEMCIRDSRYLHPDRDKRITEKALGTRYGKDYLEQSFLRKDPIQIPVSYTHLRAEP